MKVERELDKMIAEILSGLDEMENEDGTIDLDVEEFDEKWFAKFEDESLDEGTLD